MQNHSTGFYSRWRLHTLQMKVKKANNFWKELKNWYIINKNFKKTSRLQNLHSRQVKFKSQSAKWGVGNVFQRKSGAWLWFAHNIGHKTLSITRWWVLTGLLTPGCLESWVWWTRSTRGKNTASYCDHPVARGIHKSSGLCCPHAAGNLNIGQALGPSLGLK